MVLRDDSTVTQNASFTGRNQHDGARAWTGKANAKTCNRVGWWWKYGQTITIRTAKRVNSTHVPSTSGSGSITYRLQ